MAELAIRSVRKMARADCLPNRAIGTLRFHDMLIYYAGGSDHVSTEHAHGS